MAIKAYSDLDMEQNNIVGLTYPIDLEYAKSNPFPDVESLKD